MKYVYESPSGTYVVPAHYLYSFVSGNSQKYSVYWTEDLLGRPTLRLVAGEGSGITVGDEFGGLVRLQRDNEDIV